METLYQSESLSPPKKYQRLDIEFWPKQRAAFETQGTHCLFGGASEGGKSVAIKLISSAFCSAVEGLQIGIYRKYYNDVITNHMTGECNFHIILADLVRNGSVKITENQVRWIKTGSLIRLGQLRTDEDLEKIQGNTHHMLIREEATQMLERHIKDSQGWVRMSLEMKAKLPDQLRRFYPWMSDEELMEMFPRILDTGNPIGSSVGHYRRAFIEPRLPGVIEKVGAFKRVFIPSRIEDNPSADPVAQRERLEGMSGKAVADALIYGNWNTPAGDFIKEYNAELHRVPDIGSPPKGWFTWRAFDWGSGAPFCCLWLTVSDGQPFTDDFGNERWFPRGCIIVYREWYGCDPEEPSKGIRLTNEEIAEGILSRTQEVTSGLTLTDIFPHLDHGHTRMKQKYTIADEFSEAGVPLTLGNTRRKFGWMQIKKRFKGTEKGPLLVICECCKYLNDYIPALETDPDDMEDAVQDGEATHATDTLRVGVAVRPTPKDQEKEVDPLPKYAPSSKLSSTPKDILKKRKHAKRR